MALTPAPVPGVVPAPSGVPDFNSQQSAQEWKDFLNNHPGYLGSNRR